MSVESVLEKLGDNKITNKKELFNILAKVMEIIEEYEEATTGAEKKKLALSVISNLIQSAPISIEDKELLELLVHNETVDATIDLFVQIAKGEIKLKKKEIKKGITDCLMSCLKKK